MLMEQLVYGNHQKILIYKGFIIIKMHAINKSPQDGL